MITRDQFIAVGRGALVAAVGAVLTYLGQWASGFDFGVYGPAIAAVLALVTQAFHNYVNPPTQPAA